MAAQRTPAFRGRVRERRRIDRLLDGVRGGESAALVVQGDAGIGKTALLRYCSRQAAGCRVVQVAGVESELELPFAALHQLCAPMLDGLAALPLPQPQQQALRVTFGLATGSAPDRFLVGLAVLSLLAETAAARPLVCLVDDAQWLDDASAQVLGFVARRLMADSVLLVFAVRGVADERLLPALPTLTLQGLVDDEARALLTAAVPGHVDPKVRDRLVAETRGHPLALLELARGLSDAELAGGYAVPTGTPLSADLQDHYLQRVRALPEPTRRLMLLAAADPTGDATLLWRAVRQLGLGGAEAAAAEAQQLVEIGARVRFRHPLVRSAAYAAAPPQERSAAHRALAEATDAHDPDRRTWHRAAAATEPDEDVATALEEAAVRTQARAGSAAAAAFLQRSAALTAEPERRADRALAAALAYLHAGAFDTARGLLAQAESDAVHGLQRARVEQLRGQVEWASVAGRDAPVLLRQAATRLESLDVGRARETYLYAWVASTVAGSLAGPGGDLLAVSRAAQAAPRPEAPQLCDVLLDGFTTLVMQGCAAAEPTLRRAVDTFLGDQVSDGEWLQWGILAQMAAAAVWDFDAWGTLSTRHVERARASGALAALSIALNGRGMVATQCGDFDLAASLSAEKDVINEVTGIRLAASCDLFLAGYRGRLADATPLYAATSDDAISRGEGLAVQMTDRSIAVLHNGLGRHPEALRAAERAAEGAYSPLSRQLTLPELVEAAVRTGHREQAWEACQQLSATTAVEGSDWAKGLEVRSRALLSEGPDAERRYAEAVERFGRTRMRPELARSHLLFGEWLSREGRRVDARHQLRAAHDLFAAMGAEAFAERARRALLTTGERVRAREVDARTELTPQEEHIARLARDGHTNPEIAATLFLSARTVEWHLRKIFAKLEIASRKELDHALTRRGRQTPRGSRRPDGQG